MDVRGDPDPVWRTGLKFDMHVHTNRSRKCGYMNPRKLVDQAIKIGLDGIAVTDHNTIGGALEAKDIVKEENLTLQVIVGEEITTDRGEVLAYFINEEIQKGSTADVLKDIKKARGLSAIPHPFDRIRKGFSDIRDVIDDVDAIEVLNSRCLFNREALNLCRVHNKCMLAGSDAHFHQEIGKAWTIFASDPKTSIEMNKTEIGGNINNPVYLVLTKGVKLWRRVISG
jgi:hypothetical protein